MSMNYPPIARRPGRTLVTGGAGFIGTHLTTVLMATGREVLAIGRTPPNTTRTAPFACVDVMDLQRLTAVIRDFAPTEIVHLAAATGFLTKEDAEGFRINSEGTRNIL